MIIHISSSVIKQNICSTTMFLEATLPDLSHSDFRGCFKQRPKSAVQPIVCFYVIGVQPIVCFYVIGDLVLSHMNLVTHI